MNKKYLFLGIAVISLIFGLAVNSGTHPILAGAGKALFGVFFILFYITMLLENQPSDNTGGH